MRVCITVNRTSGDNIPPSICHKEEHFNTAVFGGKGCMKDKELSLKMTNLTEKTLQRLARTRPLPPSSCQLLPYSNLSKGP